MIKTSAHRHARRAVLTPSTLAFGLALGVALLPGMAFAGPQAAVPVPAPVPVPSPVPLAEPAAPSAVPRPQVVPLDIPMAAGDAAPVEVPAAAVSGRSVPLPIAKAKRSYVPQSAADRPPDGVVAVALNKARPIDLPANARDVVVGNPTIADVLVKEPRQIFITGRAVGDTNVFVLGEAGQLLRRVEIHVGPDAEGAQAAIAKLLPDDDIQVTAVGDSLFLTGKARTQRVVNEARTIARRFVPADANVINQMTLAGAQQVMLRVRVAEMNRSVVKELGMRTFFGQGGSNGGFVVNGGNAQGVSPGGIGPANPSYTFPLTGTQTNSTLTQPRFPASGIGELANEYSTLASNNPGSWFTVVPWNLMVNFSALEQEGLVKTLAEPNLMSVSGEAARLLAGGEVPIPAASVNGVVTVTYKPFGVGLVFSPVIESNGNINLKLESEVSAIDNSISVSTGASMSVPGFKTRRATTVVELPSGGSLMIAGLLADDAANTINAVPGVRDIPILGALFGSTAFQHNETELVVTVTAFLVDPVADKALAVPTDGFIPSSDLKRYFLMHLQEHYVGKPIDLPTAALKGPVGYIVE